MPDRTDTQTQPRIEGPSPEADGTHLGDRLLSVTYGPATVRLTQDLSVTWKAGEIAAGPDGVCAVPVVQDGLTAVQLTLPDDLGWVRLNAMLNRPQDRPGAAASMVLACRLLVHLPAGGAQLSPSLSRVHRKTGRADPIDATNASITLPAPGWHLIEALFACAPDTDSHRTGLILRLPEASQITLGPVETSWFAAAPPSEVLTGRLVSDTALPLRPFAARPVAASRVQTALDAPFASAMEIKDGALTGWVLASGTDAVRLAAGGQEHRLPLGQMAEIAFDPVIRLRMPYGFSTPLMALIAATPGITQVSCHLANQPQAPAFARLVLPATHGAARAERPAPAEGIILVHTPPDTGPDSYRKLLTRAMTDIRTEPGDLASAITWLEAAQAHDNPATVVLHLHGLADLLATVRTRAGAATVARAYISQLTYFVHLGGVVLWTLDGPLPEPDPQDMPQTAGFAAAWQDLGQSVIDLARIVHVHSASARDRAQALFRIPPEKILVAAHPNYLDHYPDYVQRAGARDRLGLADAKGPVFLLQGRLHPGKGLEEAVAAFAILRQTVPDAWLILMGEPVAPLRKGMLTRSYGALPHVKVIETRVADTTLQWFYRAADWVVLPYRDVVTPKALICAMSFGLPVIAPRLAPVAELVRHRETGLLYDPPAPSLLHGTDPVPALARALEAAAALPPDEARAMGEAGRTAIRPRSRARLARQLGTAIRQAWPATPVTIDFDDRPREALLIGRPFPPAAPARTAVIILNYGHAGDTRRLIDTLRAGTETDFDLYVVDNCSPNLSRYDLATRFGDVHMLRLPENLGYGAGNNAALRLIADLPYEFVWILNPDMAVPPQALAQHIAAAGAHPGTDIFGPVLLRGDAERRIASAGCYVALGDGLQTGHLYAGELLSALPNAPYEADFVTGAALFLRRSVLDRIGTLPEDYFLYFEETAWLTAARAKGNRALVLPHVQLSHHKRSEEGDLPAAYFYYYYIRNALIFAARFGGAAEGSTDAVAGTAARLRTDFIAAWTDRISISSPDRLSFYAALGDRALADGRAGRTGPVDLVALELASSGLPDPALPDPTQAERSSCTAVIDPSDGLLIGQVALAPDSAAEITALIDGRIVGHITARPVVPPMTLAGLRLHGFEMPLPARLRDGRGHRLRLCLNGHSAGSGDALPRFIPRPGPAVSGGLHTLAQHVCTGWLHDANDPETALVAEIVHDGRVIGQCLAALPAPGDAQGAPGACGFAIRLPRSFADGAPHTLTLRQAGTLHALAEAELTDTAFAAAAFKAMAAPPQQVLARLAHDPVIWFGATDPQDLPITRHMGAVTAALTARHRHAAQGALVSIILPVHNRAAPVCQAIASVQAQRYAMWELIVIDDASTDGTAAAVQAHLTARPDSRIRLIRRAARGGAAVARNTGLDQAAGELTAYLDSDDLWDPAYLEVMTGALLASPGDQAAYCGHWITQTGPEGVPDRIGLCLPPPHLALIENRDIIALSGYLHRTGQGDAARFDPALRRFSGWDMVLRQSAARLPLPVPAPLVTRRIDAPRRLTETEPREPALARLGQRHGQGLPRPDPAPLRPLDVVLALPGTGASARTATAIRRRVEAIGLTLTPGAGHRLILQLSPDMAVALADMAGPATVLLPLGPDGDGLAGLRTALERRRPSADLALLQPNALVQSGWIEALNRALWHHPEAGMLLPRHGLPGRAAAVRRHAPAMAADRDACITVSASLRNLIDPGFDRAEGLMTLSTFDPFCTYIPADAAALLGVADGPAPDLATQMAEWADFVRLHLRRPLIYCPRAPVFDMGI